MTAGVANPTLPGSPCCRIPFLWQEHALCAAKPWTCPRCCRASRSASALGSQNAEETQERSSSMGYFHHLLLHAFIFFFTLQNVIIAPGWVRSWENEPERSCSELSAASPVGLICRSVCRREHCPGQLLLTRTVSERCHWGLAHSRIFAIGAHPGIFNS